MSVRSWLLAVVLLGVALPLPQPQPGTLRVRITIVDADRQTRPVPRHALLISENPTSAAPQRAVTSSDGTAEIRLRPGNYTVESDEPLVFQGQAYEWRQTLDVPAAQTTTIEFTTANAEVTAAAARAAETTGGNASGLLLDWQDSVVTIWTPLKRGAGFLADARGLIVTNQRLVGAEKSVEVQLSRTAKVAARVLAADAEKNVAVLRVNPEAVANPPPMRLAGASPGEPPKEKDRIFTINVPLEDDRNLSPGSVKRLTTSRILLDLHIDDDSLGAPVFTSSGVVIGITTPVDENPNASVSASAADTPAIRIEAARDVIGAAEKRMAQEPAPAAAPLPVEGEALFPDDPLREAAAKKKGPLTPYRLAAADFDVSLITPLLSFAARHQGGERAPERGRPPEARDLEQLEAARRALQDFGNWWDYVRRDPPVLMIRATPKMVEPFWKTVLRGAAQTQGVSLPPIKQIKTGFSRMQLTCGETPVTPTHPFKLEHRIGQAEAVYEGFYIYDPAAVGPQCGTVTLTLFSDKAPDKGDARVIDAKLLEQIRADFAPYRTALK
jgi:S1-C subfamily serine protease